MKKIALVLLVMLAACNGKDVYSETDRYFEDNRWEKSDIKTYEFEIEQSATPYELSVFLSHVYGYQFDSAPMIAEITYPDGSLSSVKFDFRFKENDKELGECAGDFCDLSQAIPVEKPLVAGKYKLRLMHNFNAEFLPNILALGLRVTQLPD